MEHVHGMRGICRDFGSKLKMPQPYIHWDDPMVCPACGRDVLGLTIVYTGVKNGALEFRLFYEHFSTVCGDTARTQIGSEHWIAVYSPDIASLPYTDTASLPKCMHTEK